RLAIVWCDILGLHEVGMEYDFTELGGHSLNAISLVRNIQSEMNVAIPLGQVFGYPTIREMARFIDQAGMKVEDRIPAVALRSSYPLSSAQQRIFFVNRMEDLGTSYNMPDVWKITGK